MKFWKYTVFLLFLILGLTVIAGFKLPDSKLHIIACDVGQGDATLVIHKNIQILVDGGPDGKVLDCLGKYLPFWDRRIELLILTHPDRDHFLGLIEVIRRYKIDAYLYNPITISKPEYKVLEKEVGSRGIRGIHPYEGQALRIGMIQLDILAPLDKVALNSGGEIAKKEIQESETNNYSIVSLVSFGKFRGILTGDMSNKTSDDLAKAFTVGPVNYIKIPHHGSRNGLTDNLLRLLRLNTATISVGKNNVYGHPHQEILKMLRDNGVMVLRTDENGDIEFSTDGEKYWFGKNM